MVPSNDQLDDLLLDYAPIGQFLPVRRRLKVEFGGDVFAGVQKALLGENNAPFQVNTSAREHWDRDFIQFLLDRRDEVLKGATLDLGTHLVARGFDSWEFVEPGVTRSMPTTPFFIGDRNMDFYGLNLAFVDPSRTNYPSARVNREGFLLVARGLTPSV